MSDYERVEVDPEQFETIEQRFNAFGAQLQIITERLGPVDKGKSIQKTLQDGFALIAGALKGQPPIGETSVAQKLDALINTHALTDTRLENIHGLIFELTRKVDEFMATQEERLRAIKAKLDAIQTGVDKIQQQLADLKANNPELDDEISAIEETAAAIDTDVNPAAVPPPVEEPPV